MSVPNSIGLLPNKEAILAVVTPRWAEHVRRRRDPQSTRLRAVAVGGRGPDSVIGKATTRGFHQSVLSRQLSPPVKWSYRKLTLWWVVLFLSIGWIVFYINTFTKGSSAILSAPLVLFSGLSAGVFLLLLVLFWNHNQSTYKRRYSQWERSSLWQRCGAAMAAAAAKI